MPGGGGSWRPRSALTTRMGRAAGEWIGAHAGHRARWRAHLHGGAAPRPRRIAVGRAFRPALDRSAGMREPKHSVAAFDSALATVAVLAAALRGRDLPRLGQ